MSELVHPDRIEEIVGAKRRATDHIARAVSAEQEVYILHSQECRDGTPDLRTCPFSIALDQGIEPGVFIVDVPVLVGIFGGRLVCKGCD